MNHKAASALSEHDVSNAEGTAASVPNAEDSGDYYRSCAIPKPQPRCVEKARKKKLDARDERACREIVRARDKGRCRIPNCNEREGLEMHHITFRSQSAKRKWDPRNCCLLCKMHHDLRHAGVIHISGDADQELVITGDIDRLRFRL